MCKRNYLILGIAFLIPISVYIAEWFFGVGIDDPSIFRYIGRTVANGGVMYQVAWDNKGPMLFIPNVLGYLMPGLGDHGPGAIFLIMSIVSIWFFFKIVRIFVSELASSCYAVLFSCLCIGNGLGSYMNSQEMSALFFILPGVFCALKDRGRVDEVLLGIFVGCVFLIKANLVSFGGAAIFMWLYDSFKTKNWASFGRRTFFSFLGFAGVLGLITLIFVFFSAAYDMWDATLLFGLFEYCKFDVSWFEWWRSYLTKGLLVPERRVFAHYIISVALAMGGLLCLFRMKTHSRQAIYLLVWLMFDVVFTFAFKTFYLHYLIVSYAEVCILTAIANQYFGSRLLRFSLSMWCLAGCVFFGARCRGVCYAARHRESVEACAGFFRQHYKGGDVYAISNLFIIEVLNELGMSTPQKYFNLMMNYRFAGKERRVKMKEEIESYILNAPTNSCFLFDRNSEDDCRKRFPRVFERKMEINTMPNGFSIVNLL